jgi:hypothetical protein
MLVLFVQKEGMFMTRAEAVAKFGEKIVDEAEGYHETDFDKHFGP